MKRTFFRILALPMPTRGLRNMVRRLGGDKKVAIQPHITLQNILNASIDMTNIPPARGFLQYIQDANIKLLKAFDTFAYNNDIKYFMIGGAIVGHIRHSDCTPWDDDIDIGMDADNYEKFINAIEKIMPNKNFELYISCNVCKIIHTKTKAFLDILHYDIQQTPHCYDENGEKVVKKMHDKFIKKMQDRKFLSVDILYGMPQHEIKKLFQAVKTDLAETKKLQQTIFKPCGGYKTIVPLHSDCKPCEFYSYETVFPIKKIKFHGYMLPFPADPEMYAAKCWGDIWQFPTDMFRTHALTKDKTPQKLIDLRILLGKTDKEFYADFSNNKDM